MRFLALLSILVLLTGCAVEKKITIRTKPEDATIKIMGADFGKSPVTYNFRFEKPGDSYNVVASRKGFQDRMATVGRDFAGQKLDLELHPIVRHINISTSIPAILSVDGKPFTAEPTTVAATDLEFTVDAQDRWITHVISAERRGFLRSELVVQWNDPSSIYSLRLEPVKKDLTFTTNPPGAEVYVDGQKIGTSPVVDKNRSFDFDTVANTFMPINVKVSKPGFEPLERKITFDDNKTEYAIDFIPRKKTFTIQSNPAGAEVKIEGAQVTTGANGIASATLEFPPTNDQGDLKVYKVTLTKATENDMQYYPAEVEVAWDQGKTSYEFPLKEILTREVAAANVGLARANNEWTVKGTGATTLAMKFVNEPQGSQPVKIASAPAGQTIGSFCVSPDGKSIVYTAMAVDAQGAPKSQMFMVQTSGNGATRNLSDGQSIDLTPAYTPAGDAIVFASNRAGKRLNIHRVSATGEGGVTRLTMADTNDLCPSVDAESKPQLFYQAHVDTRTDPRLYVTQIGTIFQTDLTQLGGTQPVVGPRNEVLFCQLNTNTQKRDIYKVSDKGGASENLTNSPDADDHDASWNQTGARIAFSSNRDKDSEGRLNDDIYILNLNAPDKPLRLTRNGSIDDCPQWDPSGDFIYFRSNRGSEWAIWKIAVPR